MKTPYSLCFERFCNVNRRVTSWLSVCLYIRCDKVCQLQFIIFICLFLMGAVSDVTQHAQVCLCVQNHITLWETQWELYHLWSTSVSSASRFERKNQKHSHTVEQLPQLWTTWLTTHSLRFGRWALKGAFDSIVVTYKKIFDINNGLDA